MTKKISSAENLLRESKAKPGSDRAFGITFSVVFFIIGLLPLLNDKGPFWWWLVIAFIFLVIAYTSSVKLRLLNKLWFQFGLILHRIANPVVMGIIFFFVLTPTGLVLRLLGKRPLRLQRSDEVESYWIPRHPTGPDPKSLRNQF